MISQKRQYKLTIPGRSVGKESIRVTGVKYAKDGHAYVGRHFPDKTKNFVATVKQFASAAGVEMLDRAMLEIIAVIPVTMKGKQVCEPGIRPDLDNVAKSVKDALQGIAVANDKHFLQDTLRYLFVTKDQPPCTVITITECDWQDFLSMEAIL